MNIKYFKSIFYVFLLLSSVYINAQTCVVITEPPPTNAGTAANATVCKANSGLSVIDLTQTLTNEDTGGTWTIAPSSANPNTAFSPATATFNPNNLPNGIYAFIYTVGATGCQDDEMVEILIQQCCLPKICSPVTIRRL